MIAVNEEAPPFGEDSRFVHNFVDIGRLYVVLTNEHYSGPKALTSLLIRLNTWGNMLFDIKDQWYT
jgi:hypothetical protein